MKKKEPILLLALKRLFKKVRLRTILLLALTLVSNSFAWFIYSTRVSNNIQAYVKAWNVAFEVGDTNVEQIVNVTVEDVYPGMTTFSQRVNAANHSDTTAILSYEVMSANIFGTNYVVDDVDLTSAALAQQLANDYPFKIEITVSQTLMDIGDTAFYNFEISWPYESGDDAEDTYWGNMAYDYHNANPTLPSITLQVRILATQTNE